MATYCSDTDSDSAGSFDEELAEEYSNVDFGDFSLVTFGPPRVVGPEGEGEEEDIYDAVEVLYGNIEQLGYYGKEVHVHICKGSRGAPIVMCSNEV